MKLYCLAAASLMLLGAAAAEEPNLRGVATTFKEQVAEAMANPDDIEMYEWKCNRGACCNDHGPYDALVEYPKCSCPGEFDCDDDEDEGNDYDSGEGEGDYDDSGDEGGDEGHGCAHCYDAYCNDGPYESNAFLAYPKKSKEECDANGCQHIMNECDEDSEDVEMEANPDDIEMYEKTCDREACCDHGPYDALVEYDKCSCPRKKRFLCGGEHRIPPRPPQPHERGGCAHCYDTYCNDGPYESNSFLAYHKKSRKECDDNGCQHIRDQCEHHRGPPKPEPRKPHERGGCAHCYDAYCNDGPYESDSFLAYHKKSRKECDDNGCQHIKDQCERHHGGPHGHGGPPHGPPNGGGGCSRYNGNPARCAMNGCLPRGPSQCGPREDSGDVEMEDFPGEENWGPDDNEDEGNDYGWPNEDAGNDYDSGDEDGDDYDSGDESGDGYGYDEGDEGDGDGYQEGAREAMEHGEEQSGCGDGGCP